MTGRYDNQRREIPKPEVSGVIWGNGEVRSAIWAFFLIRDIQRNADNMYNRELQQRSFARVRIIIKLSRLQKRVCCPFFKLYRQFDVIGVELSGAVKNVLALGAGYIDGLGFGYNTMSAFVTRGIKEVQMLCLVFGADPLTLFGLSGAGDIMLSCFGSLSRNRTTGFRLAKGEKLEDILEDLGTVEGIPTLKVIIKYIDNLAKGSQFVIFK